MTTYVLIRFEVTHPDAYARYSALAGPSVDAFGGTFVFKAKRSKQLEGTSSLDKGALLTFPKVEDAISWYDSDEYQAAIAERAGAGQMSIEVFEA